MFLKTARRWATTGLMALLSLTAIAATTHSVPAFAQGELTRKAKTKVAPAYPDLARRTNVRGTVKVMVIVSPNGNVKDARVLGGNPILVNATLEALKKWKFEPAQDESTGMVEFKFEPQQ